MSKTVHIEAMVNGREYALDIAANHTLLDVLRDQLGLTGAKECCVVGECGACTVLVDGTPMNSCLMLAAEIDGRSVTSVEGLAVDGHLDVLQQRFLDLSAPQCGFCIPGQLMSAHALLQDNPDPTIDDVHEALGGNLCRCAGYLQITEAVLAAAEAGKE
jgi:carbon-monoxide dehydrogenase small subunit